MTTICPKCGQRYDVDQDYVDYPIDCETCGNRFLVQQPTRVPLSSARKVENLPQAREQTVEAASSLDETVRIGDETISASSLPPPVIKPLVCEMCGSSDLIKTDSVFVCQSCGTKYSVEEARKMMISGTVNVAGTVKVDNSDKVNNLYKLARRARETNDFSHAAKYYELILQEDADNWEAAFYAVYCRAWGCSIGGIQDAAVLLNNTIRSVVSIIDREIASENTRQCIYQEISSCIVNLGTMLFNASGNHYNSTGYQYKIDAGAISDMCLETGNALLEKYRQAPRSINPASFLDLWKLSVNIRGDSGVSLVQRIKDIQTIEQYDSEYNPPESWKMIWRQVARAILFMGAMWIVCWIFGWHPPYVAYWGAGFLGYKSAELF